MIVERSRLAPPLLPPARDRATGFVPCVLGLAVYVAALAAIGLIVLNGTLAAADRSLGTALTLQVPAETSGSRLATIMAVLRRTKGIASAHLFEATETARLLEPWLGPAVPLDELPVPRLIDIRIDAAAPPDLAALHNEIQSVMPQARLEDHRGGLDRARTAGRRAEIVLAGLIAVALLLVAASAAFAAGARLMIQRADIEVLHLLGVPDAAIARRFAAGYLGLGLLGGAAGVLPAILTITVLGQVDGLVQLPAPAANSGIADWRFWAVLGGAVIATALVAMASAALTARRWLARLP
jgi:cell division transport system permease protein